MSVSRETGKISISPEVLAGLARQQLALRLGEILRVDPSMQPEPPPPYQLDDRYRSRNAHIYAALSHATDLGYPCGLGPCHLTVARWPVAYIDLPTGQVSWHLPPYPGRWDGHNNLTVVDRANAFIASVDAE